MGPGFWAAFSLETQRSAAFRRGLHLLRLVNQRRLTRSYSLERRFWTAERTDGGANQPARRRLLDHYFRVRDHPFSIVLQSVIGLELAGGTSAIPLSSLNFSRLIYPRICGGCFRRRMARCLRSRPYTCSSIKHASGSTDRDEKWIQ